MSDISFFTERAGQALTRMRERVEFFSMSNQCTPAAATTLLREMDDFAAAIDTLVLVLGRKSGDSDQPDEDAEVRPPIGN